MELLDLVIVLGIMVVFFILYFALTKLFDVIEKYISDKIDNERVLQVIKVVEDIVLEVVRYTNQTYVDELKKTGKFDDAARRNAFSKTCGLVKKFLSNKYYSAIKKIYNFNDSEMDSYLKCLIESAVSAENDKKNG